MIFINPAKKLLSHYLFLPLAGSRRFIFGFHNISNPGSEYHSPRYSAKIKNFEKQIKFLKSNFNIIPLDRLVNDMELSNKHHYASIVFDDEFYSVLKNADLNQPLTINLDINDEFYAYFEKSKDLN